MYRPRREVGEEWTYRDDPGGTTGEMAMKMLHEYDPPVPAVSRHCCWLQEVLLASSVRLYAFEFVDIRLLNQI